MSHLGTLEFCSRFGGQDDQAKLFQRNFSDMRYSNISWTFLLLLCFVSMADAEYMKYKDPKQPINSRIRDLIGRMTLAEKIGQMTQIERQVASADVTKQYFIGKFYVSPESFAAFMWLVVWVTKANGVYGTPQL